MEEPLWACKENSLVTSLRLTHVTFDGSSGASCLAGSSRGASWLPKIQSEISQLGGCQNIVVRKNKLQATIWRVQEGNSCRFSWLVRVESVVLCRAEIHSSLVRSQEFCYIYYFPNYIVNSISLQSLWLYHGSVTKCLQISRFRFVVWFLGFFCSVYFFFDLLVCFGWNLVTKYQPVVLNGTDNKKYMSGRNFSWNLCLAPNFFLCNAIGL